MHVTSYCNLLAPVRLSFISRSARMSLLQVERLLIIEDCLTSRSHRVICQNELMDTFTYSLVPNKSTVSRLVTVSVTHELFTDLN